VWRAIATLQRSRSLTACGSPRLASEVRDDTWWLRGFLQTDVQRSRTPSPGSRMIATSSTAPPGQVAVIGKPQTAEVAKIETPPRATPPRHAKRAPHPRLRKSGAIREPWRLGPRAMPHGFRSFGNAPGAAEMNLFVPKDT
jgi:hypothetical protein